MNNMLPKFSPGRAVLFKGPGTPFEQVLREVPALEKGQILVRNTYTTLCGSDLHTYCGHRTEPSPVVLGHEIVGNVLAYNLEEPLKDSKEELVQIGDRIIWSIFAVPSGVAAPREDMPQKSDSLFKYGHALASADDIFNGGMADYCILRENTAFLKVPDSLPLKVAATISCAHATVMGSLRIAEELKGKRVLIFGAGLLGISCVAMCREAGAAWIGLVDTDGERLKWGTRFGADECFHFPESTAEALPWPQADKVFDMTGNPAAMETGIASLALGGTAIWIGAVFPAAAVRIDAQQLVRRLLEIKGLHNYNYEDFINATAFIINHHDKYPFEALIEKEYPLEEVAAAFEFADTAKPVRVGIII